MKKNIQRTLTSYQVSDGTQATFLTYRFHIVVKTRHLRISCFIALLFLLCCENYGAKFRRTAENEARKVNIFGDFDIVSRKR